jgi:hypothetical protein
VRDYEEWHRAYDDPDSSLSWRLRVVSGFIDGALDSHAGGIRVLSACSGDGRDLFGVLSRRSDAARVTAVLVELHPEIADRARIAVANLAAHVEVRTGDAGASSSYLGAVPADLVIMVGIFGNIDDVDLGRTIATIPQFCTEGATVLWSRGVDPDRTNDGVRAQFADHGFVEIDYEELAPNASGPAVGMVRYTGPSVELEPGRHLFSFYR